MQTRTILIRIITIQPQKLRHQNKRKGEPKSMTPMSQKEKGDTFEEGARRMQGAMRSQNVESYYANGADPLHAGFLAKAIIHSGPGGMPLMGESAREKLAELYGEKRTGKSLAYVHVPFCETRCLYCMFYQNPYQEEAVHAYAGKLIGEFEQWADKNAQKSAPIHAVYFGGGTPTAFSPEDLKRVLLALKKNLPLANDCEITIEGRIHNFTDEKMEAALEGGANRFSLGVQTFNSAVRQSVQRVDGRDAIIERLNQLCSYDDAAVVIDLIYGFPGQTMQVWQDDLATAASLSLDGIDCYQLNVFEKSPLAKYIANGKLPRAATQAEKADFFAYSVEYLTGQNWRRLSNNHWGSSTRERNIYNALGKSACDCLAFGCGAGGRLFGHSFMTERKLADYYALLDGGQKPVSFLMAPKPNWHLLRTISADMESGAINIKKIGAHFGVNNLESIAQPVLSQWCEAGMLEHRGDWYYQSVAGQYWHVTLAQLLMDWVEPHLPGAQQVGAVKMDMGAPGNDKPKAELLTVAGAARILQKFPQSMRDMARMMPKAVVLKAIKDTPREKWISSVSAEVTPEAVLALMQNLSKEDLDALLKTPEKFL